MNYCLINCYSDNNKGDLGIILSTIHLLKEYDSSAEVSAISTYNHDDPAFMTDHVILRKYTHVYPSIFGELNIGRRKDAFSKIARLTWDSIRLLFIIICKSKLFLSRNERLSLKKIEESDFVVSKGGSFLCNEKTFRTKIALIRFFFLFWIIFRLFPNKKVVILCQSLGPVYGSISTRIMNFVLRKCDKIVLREDVCVGQYPNIVIPEEKKYCLNDIAFHLPAELLNDSVINRRDGRIKVGVTMKTMSVERNAEFQQMMIESLEYIISKYNADLYIYPHVTKDDDVDASFRVYRRINDKYKEHIFLLTNNYTSGQLKSLYAQMDFFIASRLHSSIFAIGEGIPSIVIAYHGTKAQGVFANYGLEDWVVQDYSPIVLKEKIDDMVLQYKRIRSELTAKVEQDHLAFMELFKIIFSRESNAEENY